MTTDGWISLLEVSWASCHTELRSTTFSGSPVSPNDAIATRRAILVAIADRPGRVRVAFEKAHGLAVVLDCSRQVVVDVDAPQVHEGVPALQNRVALDVGKIGHRLPTT